MPKKTDIETIRHSTAHVLAAAVLKLFPKVKFGIGPAIENGFYYDFDSIKISQSDLKKIESEMKKIISQNAKFEKKQISKSEAEKLFKNQPYKLELIKDLEKISIYQLKDFIDLCKGPHVKSTKEIDPGAFKITRLAGAYWKGNEKNKMLTRIYGVAFKTKKELDKYSKQQEEAEKRDHRKIGKELDLFSIDEYVGPGLILWHPKLSVVREEIELYWRQEHRKNGYQYIYTPHIGMANLWKKSGHLSFFKDGMYPAMSMEQKDQNEKTAYYVKPMSCPFHVQIYKSRPRSYRELPLRWCELGSVYRYEESGVLHGMLRVRGFTQDDAHVICREDQFIDEVNRILDFALSMNKTFGYDKLNVYLSVREPNNKKKYVGEERIWNLAEKTLARILKKRQIKFKKDVGGAKFYGPAIDLKAVDAIGREWQGTTIQLDMNLPARFGMVYTGQDGQKHTPIMLHRTLLGSMERFVGTLIEHCAGAFPIWLAPVQAQILPIGKSHTSYAKKILKIFKKEGLRIELNESNETIGKKIRQGELQKIPYLLIVGDKEIKAKTVSVRHRHKGDTGAMKIDEFIEKIKKEIEGKK